MAQETWSPEAKKLGRRLKKTAEFVGGGVVQEAKNIHKTNKRLVKIGTGIRKVIAKEPINKMINKKIKSDLANNKQRKDARIARRDEAAAKEEARKAKVLKEGGRYNFMLNVIKR